jgi:hypothetical protein
MYAQMAAPVARIAFLAALVAALVLAPAAHGWVRQESDRWVWYVPNGKWVDAQSDNGIDISSPTGSLYVGHGFGPTPGPVTHQQVVDYLVQSRALDLHPLRRVRFTRRGAPVQHEGIVRRVYEWRSFRTDRRERVRGVLTVDVLSNDVTLSYGFSTYGRVAPLKQFKRWNRRLRFIERHVLLKPRSPDWSNAFPETTP